MLCQASCGDQWYTDKFLKKNQFSLLSSRKDKKNFLKISFKKITKGNSSFYLSFA